MGAIDAWLEGFIHGSEGLWVILLVGLFLGLRHASDPDHLAAVTTLIASEEDRVRVRKASFMGLSWGFGHGTTLTTVGLPLVIFGSAMPEPLQRTTEVVIGTVIVFLAVRLLHRWWYGAYHAHDERYSRRALQSYAANPSGDHHHGTPVRTALSAYGIGLVHGTGGSGGAHAAVALEHPRQGTGCGSAAGLRRRVGDLHGPTFDCLRPGNRGRSRGQELRAGGSGTGMPEHGPGCLVHARGTGLGHLPLLIGRSGKPTVSSAECQNFRT